MPRPQRHDYPGAWHHVINRGVNHAAIFTKTGDRDWFLECLKQGCVEHAIEVHAYCLMGNHYHLLVRSLAGELGEAMQWLSARYTQGYNKHHKRDGPLFRGRYGAVRVETDGHLLNVSRYIHVNPVQAFMVSRPQDYPWSSAAAYLGATRPAWLIIDTLLAIAGDPATATSTYCDFLSAGVDDATAAFYASGRIRPVFQLHDTKRADGMGSDPFSEGV
jgi:putative transposase